MPGTLRFPLATRRLFLGAFVVYLIVLLGYLGASHHHAEGDGRPGSHQDCPLCQASQQPFVVPDPLACPETPGGPVALVESVWAPILACRHRPFASRAPPAA